MRVATLQLRCSIASVDMALHFPSSTNSLIYAILEQGIRNYCIVFVRGSYIRLINFTNSFPHFSEVLLSSGTFYSRHLHCHSTVEIVKWSRMRQRRKTNYRENVITLKNFPHPSHSSICLSYFSGRYANDTHTIGVQRKREGVPPIPPFPRGILIKRQVKYSKYLSLRLFNYLIPHSVSFFPAPIFEVKQDRFLNRQIFHSFYYFFFFTRRVYIHILGILYKFCIILSFNRLFIFSDLVFH